MRRSIVAVLATALLFAVGSTATAAEPATTGRLAGETRYETAVAISRATFPQGTSEVVIARGDLFPDALVASFLASLHNGNHPILLTQRDELPAAVLAELRRLKPERVYIMGNEGAVTAAVEAKIRAEVREVERVAGENRYDTAYVLSTKVGEARRFAFVVSGEDFPDAIAVAPVANLRSVPVILTTQASLHEAARRALDQLDVQRVYIVGGTAAVSEQVEAELRLTRTSPDGPVLEVVRVAGRNRFETATSVADLALGPDFRLSAQHVNLSRGDGFADAVAGGPHGGAEVAVTLFVEAPDRLGSTAAAWLREHASTISSLHALGDQGVISDGTLAEAAQAAG